MDISEKWIIEAYCFLRENNNNIPTETLDFMKEVSLKELSRIENSLNDDFTLNDYTLKEVSEEAINCKGCIAGSNLNSCFRLQELCMGHDNRIVVRK